MKRAAVLFVLSGLALVTAADAQPVTPKTDSKPETVIVTAPRFHAGVTPNAIAHDFVKSFAAPTVLREAIARWEVGICPDFEGLAPQYAEVMENHLRAIAGQARARMKEKGCRPNLLVVFTPTPQDYLDALHAKSVGALGYHATTKIVHPIQAFYSTGIRDADGHISPDIDTFFDVSGQGAGEFRSVGTTPSFNVGGWRARPDLSSDLLYVTIIVNSSKTGSYQVGEIADLVAMLGLSRTDDYEDCQLMPSITNLLSSNCDEKLKPDAITASDIAYLRGVYKMDAGATLKIQQNQIAAEMEKAIPATAAPAGGSK